MESCREYSVAIVFGVISPKIKTKKVRAPVAIPIYLFPNTDVQKVVVSADADMFAMLLPTRIALRSLLGFSVIFNTFFALRFPSSISERSFIWLTVVSAVSEEEKKADNISKIIITIICNAGLVSKKNHSFDLNKFPIILSRTYRGVKILVIIKNYN